jgi:hypothetical protein
MFLSPRGRYALVTRPIVSQPEVTMDETTVPPPTPQSAAPGVLPYQDVLPYQGTPPLHVVDAAGVVVAEAPCRKCSYNLKGLAVTGRCPECGTPVGVSVHGDLLRYSDPQWVMELSHGTAYMFWGILLGIAVGFVGGLVAAALGPWIGPFLNVIGGAVSLYGAWLLTQPDPSGIGEDKYGTSRRIIRIGLAANVLGYVVQIVGVTTVPPPEMRVAIGVVAVVVGLVGVVGQFATLRYLERLSLRLPDERLSKSARTLFWGYGITLLATVLLGGIVAVAMATARGGPGAGPLGVIGCVAVIALLVFGIWFLVLLRQLQGAFAQQAHYARQIWNNSATA